MTIYVDSNRTGGSDNGTSWTDAYLTIQQGLTNAAAGEEIWVAAGSTPHNETLASGDQTLLCANGTIASPCRVLSIDPSDDSYDPVTTAQITSNTPSTDDIRLDGFAVWVGLGFYTCIMYITDTTNPKYKYYKDCYFKIENCMQIDSYAYAEFYNCTFAHIGSSLNQLFFGSGTWVISDCYFPAPTDTTPTAMFAAGSGSCAYMRNCDLSNYTNIVTGLVTLANYMQNSIFEFSNCKVASGEPLYGGSPTAAQQKLLFHNCGAGNTNVDITYFDYYGTVTDSTTIYLSGSDGVTSYSLVMDHSGNGVVESILPLRYELGAVYFDASAGDQIKVNITYDGAQLQNDECWIEVEYPDDTTNLGLIVTTNPGIKVTPSNLTSNSESWTGTGGFSAGKTDHLITGAISDGKAGMAKVYICLAKDQTIYVDSKIVIV